MLKTITKDGAANCTKNPENIDLMKSVPGRYKLSWGRYPRFECFVEVADDGVVHQLQLDSNQEPTTIRDGILRDGRWELEVDVEGPL